MFSKQKSMVVISIIVLITMALSAISYFGIGSDKFLGVARIKQGLDLQGGVTIVYEADVKDPTAEEMNAAWVLMRGRLDRMGDTEAEVALQGNNRIRVDIPGVKDAESAIKSIGETALLTFEGPDGVTILDGRQVKTANRVSYTKQEGALSEVAVSLEFDSEGTIAFAEATTKFKDQPIHIKLDGVPISSPTVNDAITDGKAIISGNFTPEEAEELAARIRAGSLPFKLNVVSMSNIGAKLGADSLTTSLLAGLIGSVLVLLFMLFVYRSIGLAANLALVLYLAIELVVLSLFEVTLTLPGMAGIVLSVGMAVDANIIIFERLKEEMKIGRTMRFAVDGAFKRAFSAILDGNVTTLIAAAVLFGLGTGPIKGFAQTLAIGIVISMFTALVITKLLLKSMVGLGMKNNQQKDEKENNTKQLNIIQNKRKYFAVSAFVLAIGVLFMIINVSSKKGAFNYDVEFSGGTAMHINIGQDFNNADITQIITQVTGQNSPQVVRVLGTNEVMLKILSIDQETRKALVTAISEKYGLTEENILDIDDMDASVSGEMKSKAVLAVTIACLAMLVYVSIRFRNVATGSSAVLALVHDALIMLCAYVIIRIPLNYSFIAAILTVLGYSINSTIVIFDRVRENKSLIKETNNEDYNETLINTSVSQTMTRSIYTTLTTLFTITALYVLGVQSIKEFALPIIVGIVCGTYSSVFLSGSIWYVITNARNNRKLKKA